MGRPRSSTRLLVQSCAVARIEQVRPRPTESWETLEATISATCPAYKHLEVTLVPVSRTRQGPRFLCPKCNRPARRLYLPPSSGLANWGCQRCHRLAYSCQYVKPSKKGGLRGLAVELEQKKRKLAEMMLDDQEREEGFNPAQLKVRRCRVGSGVPRR